MNVTYLNITRGSVHVNNYELYYETCGHGEPLVLLHGFGACIKTWYPFFSELAAHYSIIAIDLPGHGKSTNPTAVFSHQHAAKIVLQLLSTLAIESFSAMGISSGGMILVHMALLEPMRIKGMVLISATTHFPDAARAIMRNASFKTMPSEVINMYRTCASRGDEQIMLLINQFNSLAATTADVYFDSKQLASIKAATLIIHGDSDKFFPVSIAYTLYRAIPNASLWVIPNGEHVPIYDESVPFINRSLQFLQKASSSGLSY